LPTPLTSLPVAPPAAAFDTLSHHRVIFPTRRNGNTPRSVASAVSPAASKIVQTLTLIISESTAPVTYRKRRGLNTNIR
jgi:hypothetical protein